MRSHHKFNEHEAVAAVVEQLRGGAVLALISDAGTPGISDPGFLLSRECRRQGVEVETLPGATAFVPALVNSGLPCDRFVFEGFLPQKKGRATRLEELKGQPLTMVFYESPVRHWPRPLAPTARPVWCGKSVRCTTPLTTVTWANWWTILRLMPQGARSLSSLPDVPLRRRSRSTSMPSLNKRAQESEPLAPWC